MREIKFRAWETDDKKMILSYAHVGKDGVMHTVFMDGSHDYKVMQYTGLKDKNGVEIYEGDVVRIRNATRSYQEHRGDNIPFNGYFRERLEPFISKSNLVVENFGTDEFTLLYIPMTVDRDDAINGFESSNNEWIGDEGDLDYLLHEYGFNSESELLSSLGVEVIGNIYEHPELLDKDNA